MYGKYSKAVSNQELIIVASIRYVRVFVNLLFLIVTLPKSTRNAVKLLANPKGFPLMSGHTCAPLSNLFRIFFRAPFLVGAIKKLQKLQGFKVFLGGHAKSVGIYLKLGFEIRKFNSNLKLFYSNMDPAERCNVYVFNLVT